MSEAPDVDRPTPRGRVRFGILCGGTTFPAWQARCLRQLLATEGVEAALIVVDARPAECPTFWQKVRRFCAKDTLWRVFYKFAVARRSVAERREDLSRDLAGVPLLEAVVEKKGKFSEYFTASDLAVIREHDLDFMLRFGFGILRGEALTVARYGVWSYHHGDPEAYRGGPPGLWEIIHDTPVTGVILQRLTEKLDGGIIMRRGWFRTITDSYVRSRDHTYFAAAGWAAAAARDVLAGDADYLDAAPVSTDAPIYRAPGNLQTVGLLLRLARNLVRAQTASLFRGAHWNVGLVDRPIASFLTESRARGARWMPGETRAHFRADPFGFLDEDGALTVLYEDFDHRLGRGVIAAAAWDGADGLGAATEISDDEHHLSYPFVLEHDARTLVIPECCLSHSAVLHELAGEPRQMQRLTPVIDDFAAVDSTIVRYGDRWWLFCTDGDGAAGSNLHLFHADRPEGPWTPHRKNPVKCDVRGSRPAGTPFVHEGALYRPAQDGSETYGGAVAIQRITALDIDRFAEERVATVLPDPAGPYPQGLHTLSAVGDRTLIDGRHDHFAPWAFWRALRSKLRRLIGLGPSR